MLYMVSQATGDGQLSLTVTFALGTDLDTAQVLVQNRVAIAEPRLPEEVRRLGVTVRKNSPDMLMVIHLSSPDGSRDQLYISNYATLQVRDVLARLDGVGDVRVFGARDYSMRIWLDPDKVAARNLTAGEVLAALRGQNVQVASGVLNQPPVPEQGAFQLNVETLGRLRDAREFENIVVKTEADGRVTRIRDIARVELGAQDYNANGYLDERQAVPLLIFQRPGSNALATAEEVLATMAELAQSFPPGLRYDVVYNPTEFIAQSVDAVFETIYEAVLLVVIVVILFLQTWRASIIPIVAIPVSLIGTFAVMAALGYSLNNLSLFGLVLAIGIVVDDAIVVVENVERNLALGHEPEGGGAPHHGRGRRRADRDRAGAGRGVHPGRVHPRHLGPVLPPVRRDDRGRHGDLLLRLADAQPGALRPAPEAARSARRAHAAPAPPGAGVLQRLQPRLRQALARLRRADPAAGAHRRPWCSWSIVGLIGLTGWQFARAPTGFIPEQDQGYLITVIQLPPGASLARTDAVVRRATEIILGTDGVVARGAVRRLRRRDLHQCPERRRDLLGAGAVRGARRVRPERERHPRRSERQALHHPGGVHHHHPAAARARHRHRRRLQDDGPGPARPRARGARGGQPGAGRRRQPDARARPACSRCSTPARPRSSPTSTA